MNNLSKETGNTVRTSTDSSTKLLYEPNRYGKTIENFRNNLDDLSNNLDRFLKKTVDVGQEFGGPSVYFHKKALIELDNDFLGDNHLNMIYAVMPAWGMHRMGSKGAKMVNFNIFKNEILKNKSELTGLQSANFETVNINDLVKLITDKIHISTTESYLVSSSKVLHHILPNIISPIDRNYSIRFMKQNKHNFNTNAMAINNEEAYASIFLEGMFDFMKKHENELKKYVISINDENIFDNNMNTSVTKIFDNLIVSYVKLK